MLTSFLPILISKNTHFYNTFLRKTITILGKECWLTNQTNIPILNRLHVQGVSGKNRKHEQDNLTISLIYEIYSKTCTSIQKQMQKSVSFTWKVWINGIMPIMPTNFFYQISSVFHGGQQFGITKDSGIKSLLPILKFNKFYLYISSCNVYYILITLSAALMPKNYTGV